MKKPTHRNFMNLEGQVFGRLKVLEYVGVKWPKKRTKGHIWKVQCKCGVEKIVLGSCLRKGDTISCGCYHKEIVSGGQDLTGNRYGRLLVEKKVGSKHNSILWLCKCDCGKTKEIISASLKHGRSRSCGCRQGMYKHGLSKTKGYKKYLYHSNPVRKMRQIVGIQVRQGMKSRGFKKNGKSVWNYLPYTPENLCKHLESQFEPWMTWENYGDKWHIDHIIAQIKFPYVSMFDPNFIECWSLSNLRPLEKKENLKKGSK